MRKQFKIGTNYMESISTRRKTFIKNHRKRLMNSRKTWTSKEIEFIRKEFPTMDKEELEKHLGTSYKKIYQMAFRLGVKREV